MTTHELLVSKWLNTDEHLSLQKLKGKVIAIHAFQMLCPGCVLHGIPQALKLFETFNPEHVAVIGLHTVFEHHEGMQEESLKAFLHEFRVKFPIAIDMPSSGGGSLPQTMELYQMQGTPTWLIFDRTGELKIHAFGQMTDMVLGSEITRLSLENNEPNIKLYKGKNK